MEHSVSKVNENEEEEGMENMWRRN
jgi:hypothetical protein